MRHSWVGSIQAAQPLYSLMMLINSDSLTKLLSLPQACAVPAPERTGSSHRACSGKGAPACPERSASSLTSYPCQKDRPALNIWVFTGTDGDQSARVAQTGVPISSSSSQDVLKIPGTEHRTSTAQRPAASRASRQEKAETEGRRKEE